MAGYLVLKPTAGAAVRRRVWCVLEPSRLVYYRSSEPGAPELGEVDIQGAAISLQEDNTFVLHLNGREHALIAEDHEAMMGWIHAIQAKQEKLPATEAHRTKPLQRAHSLQLPPEKRKGSLRRMLTQVECNGKGEWKGEEEEDARVQLLRKMNSSSESIVSSELETEIMNNSKSEKKSPVQQCRMLQKQNRFLNEEVLKLANMLQQEKKKTEHANNQVCDLQSAVDVLKRDYVFLLQSSLRISNSDGPETRQVYLYGGHTHKERVITLLEEARKINPTLPVYENLCRGGHVDSLGFRHCFAEECLTLHYICRQLHQHYSSLGARYDQHLQHWKKHLRQNPALPPTKELKLLVRSGVPAHLRRRVWPLLYRARVQDIIDSKGPHYYNFLCSLAPDDKRVTHHKRQIALDLLRTMPDNIRFADANADGVQKMQEVLQAFCVHNPALGYCQGMNFIVGMCLLFVEPEDAFWCLVGVSERYLSAHYFDRDLIGAQADQEVLKELLREKMPDLAAHFQQLDIELATVTLNWFLAIFFDCVPFETLVRIWDCFLLEGPKVLFRFSLALLKMHERPLLEQRDTLSCMRQLKAAAKLCFDAQHLFQTAFEVVKPFTRRKDISSKQAYYYKTLKEHAKKMEIAKKDREIMLSEVDCSNNQLVIECAAVYDNDKLWLCHGHQNRAQITKVNCEENIMYRLNIEIESRVMCMHALDDDTMLLGTLSHFVHAYSTKARHLLKDENHKHYDLSIKKVKSCLWQSKQTLHISFCLRANELCFRRLLWETRLNDSVLSLASYEEDGMRQVYAGLADGSVAVIEEGEKPETFYILIGSNPVTCLRLVERRLWCATGNRVVILNTRTLDSIDQFHTSSSCLDYLSMLMVDDRGVWLSIRGSSVLQLWDPQSLTCKLLFDVRDNNYPRSPKVCESSEEGSRITALLPFSGSVLVGTAEGALIIFHVSTKLSRTPSAQDINSQPVRMDSGCYSTPLLPSESPETKLCTCHGSAIKCRHCLLEASEPLRKLFEKYSLNSRYHRSKEEQMQETDMEVLSRSADDVTQWVTSASSLASDSYDFDDVFVTYTEDEGRRRRSSNILDYSADLWRSETSSGTSLQMGDWPKSETASNVSFSSTDVPYAFELNLQEKIKISDKPIKCLLETRCGSETTLISCAGCYGDDEAVLKWTKVGDEELWTNDPIIEVCPYTNTIKPSPFVRSRLPTRTLSGVNTGHNIFLRG